MANSVSITGSSFDDLAKAIKNVQTKANSAHKSINKIFNVDYSSSKIFNNLDKLAGRLAILSIRAKNIAADIKTAMNTGGAALRGTGGPRGPRRPLEEEKAGFRNPLFYLDNVAFRSYRNRMLANSLLDFKSNSVLSGAGNPFFVSKFGNPGQMPLVSRFRVFQRPFPGSERNPFALGDAGNIANNLVYSTGRSLETVFKSLVTAGTDSVRVLSAFSQIGLAGFASIARLIPGVGKYLEKFAVMFASVLDFGTKALTGFVDKLGAVIGGTINLVTNIGLGLSGLAYRAVQAASTLTELKNAAAIYVGQGADRLVGTAMDYQARYGLSATDSLRIMTRVAGQVRQTTGVSGEMASKDAVDIFKAVSEAGSVLNMSIDDIGKTIQSALAGRYTPLRRIGVAVSAPYLDMVAEQMGFTKDAKTPFEARNKALTYELKRQTSPYLGDLAATQYEFANQQRKILGLFESIFVQAGRVLEPFAKILLITSNDVLTKLNNTLRAFADSVKNVAGGSLDRFGAAIARAGDYALYFGQMFYDNRGEIGSGLADLFTTLVESARNLTVFSLRMISVLAGVIESFSSLIPSIKDLTLSFASAAEFIGRQFGFQTQGQKAADTAFQKDESLIRSARIEANKFKLNASDQLSPEKLVALQRQSQIAQSRVDQVNSGMPRSFVYGTDKGPLEGIGISQKLSSFADSIQSLNSVTDIQDLFSKLFGVAPNVLQNPFARATMDTSRTPNFIPPGEFEKQTGNLVKYFNPAAFRDEVQTRQLDAMQQTAENTGKMVEILQNETFRQGQGPLYPVPLTAP